MKHLFTRVEHEKLHEFHQRMKVAWGKAHHVRVAKPDS